MSVHGSIALQPVTHAEGTDEWEGEFAVYQEIEADQRLPENAFPLLQECNTRDMRGAIVTHEFIGCSRFRYAKSAAAGLTDYFDVGAKGHSEEIVTAGSPTGFTLAATISGPALAADPPNQASKEEPGCSEESGGRVVAYILVLPLSRACDQLRKELEVKMIQEHGSLRGELAATQATLRELYAENSQIGPMRTRLSTLQQDLDQAKVGHSSCQAELTALQTGILADIGAEGERLRILQEAIAERDACRSDLSSVRDELASAQVTLAGLHADLARFEEERRAAAQTAAVSEDAPAKHRDAPDPSQDQKLPDRDPLQSDPPATQQNAGG